MTERPALSKGELEVARVLWELGKASVREVHAALGSRTTALRLGETQPRARSDSRSVEFATVQTYLRRLENKGYVSGRLEGRIRIYTPKVKPQTVIRETLNDLVDRLFGGEALPLMRHLIEERGITDDELAELRKMIDRLDQKHS